MYASRFHWFIRPKTVFPVIKRYGSSSAKRRLRIERNKILRTNRHDPQLEEAARLNQLMIPLDVVYHEWQDQLGPRHLQTAAEHFNIFQDLYCTSFRPRGFIGVTYKEGCVVNRGNILYPRQVLDPPTIVLPSLLEGRGQSKSKPLYWTLIMTNPDGHTYNNKLELLHWMIGNIPVNGPLLAGHTLSPYLPPLPLRGTGVHRIVFSLFSHNEPLPITPINETGSWLEQRTFSMHQFLSSHSDLSPFTLCFFQTLWDETVHHVFMDTLGVPEPVYEMEKLPTSRQLAQKAIKEARKNRFKDLVTISRS